MMISTLKMVILVLNMELKKSTLQNQNLKTNQLKRKKKNPPLMETISLSANKSLKYLVLTVLTKKNLLNHLKKKIKEKIEMKKLNNKIGGTTESLVKDLTTTMTVTIEMISTKENLVIMIVIVIVKVAVEENNTKRRITLLIQIPTLESFI